MNNRLFVGGLLIVLIGLIALAVWQATPRPQTEQTPVGSADLRDTLTVFRGFTTEMMQALRIDDPFRSTDLILERDDTGGWRLVGTAANSAIDPLIADNIAKTIAFLPYEEIIGSIESDEYVNFGLNSESVWLQIQVILKTTETYNVAVGALVAGSQNGYYALIDDRPEIYILNRGAVEYLEVYLRQAQSR